ncbi:hypothetical protein [Vibrio sp. MEBiC08052]|uniref:hypothetical protein n=1 Tax=Vibrio sp. MEBiC08052 TaxID=1761910 RepID=UPI0007407166|nr:hypothetical protein [Vibrio sp. MEBiC08052]KUI97870.1 hypothetical protein VRK_25710 [Vibrio sp. MEBiC08052]
MKIKSVKVKSHSSGALAEWLMRDILRAKARTEDEKFSPLQDYFSVDDEAMMTAKPVGIKMPCITDEGIRYQVQWIPLYMLCPCRFFKVESLSLELNAYLEQSDRHNTTEVMPQVTLSKKSRWWSNNTPVKISLQFSESSGHSISIESDDILPTVPSPETD